MRKELIADQGKNFENTIHFNENAADFRNYKKPLH